MEFKDLKQQLSNLMAMGYDRKQIIEMVEQAPAIFKYTPEGMKIIFDSIDKSDKVKLIDIDSFVFPKEIIKVDDKTVGYSINSNDAQKVDIIETIIAEENYPLETLPENIREIVINARQLRENQHGEAPFKKR